MTDQDLAKELLKERYRLMKEKRNLKYIGQRLAIDIKRLGNREIAKKLGMTASKVNTLALEVRKEIGKL